MIYAIYTKFRKCTYPQDTEYGFLIKLIKKKHDDFFQVLNAQYVSRTYYINVALNISWRHFFSKFNIAKQYCATETS